MAEHVRVDELHRRADLVGADRLVARVLLDDLGGPDVRELERHGVPRDAGVALGILALEHSGPLAADAHRDPDLGGRAREIVVDLRGVREPSCHPGDDDGGAGACDRGV